MKSKSQNTEMDMPKIRPGWSGKYKLGKHEFYMTYHFALKYRDWIAERDDLVNSVQAIRYDKDRVQTSPSQDTLERTAIKIADLSHKIQMIESTAIEADPVLYSWIIKAATTEGVTFNALKNPSSSGDEPIPCERDMYYDRRRKFYFLLYHKLDGMHAEEPDEIS